MAKRILLPFWVIWLATPSFAIHLLGPVAQMNAQQRIFLSLYEPLAEKNLANLCQKLALEFEKPKEARRFADLILVERARQLYVLNKQVFAEADFLISDKKFEKIKTKIFRGAQEEVAIAADRKRKGCSVQ